MSNTVPYDVWLHWNINLRCNIDCEYCFLNPVKKSADPPTIDIETAMRSISGIGKTCKINLTGGGEPFLVKNIIELIKELTKEHYVTLNSNLTPSNIKTFAKEIDPKRVHEIHASLHLQELERKNMTSRYIEHFLLCKEMGFNIYAQAVGYPKVIPELDKFKKIYGDAGIDFNFSPYIGTLNGKKYPDSYSEDELKALGLSRKDVDSSFRYKNKPCNAGYNIAFITPSGKIHSCTQLYDNLGNISKEINLKKDLTLCPFDFCNCPLGHYDQGLWDKALSNKKLVAKKPSFVYTAPYKAKALVRDVIRKFES